VHDEVRGADGAGGVDGNLSAADGARRRRRLDAPRSTCGDVDAPLMRDPDLDEDDPVGGAVNVIDAFVASNTVIAFAVVVAPSQRSRVVQDRGAEMRH
jgi:hypothetical protein